jgi:hypothetical protein
MIMSDTAADIDHLWKLIDDIPVAMVVTRDGQDMRARPMAIPTPDLPMQAPPSSPLTRHHASRQGIASRICDSQIS